MKLDRYKYLHVVSRNGVSFISSMIDLLGGKDCICNTNEHLFVTKDKDLFTNNRSLFRIVYDTNKEVNIINSYGKNVDYIFIHGFHSTIFDILRINPRLDKKIIWRTWGHDIVLPTPNKRNFLKTIYRYFSFWLLKVKVRRFHMIGIANVVDEIKVRRAFGDRIQVPIIPYGRPIINGKSRSTTLMHLKKKNKKYAYTKIMIGHSGFSIDNHIELMEKLYRFKDNDILLSLPLAYGNNEYIKTVKKHAEHFFKGKYEIIEQRVPYFEYAEYINSIDIALFDMINTAGLGNVNLLLYFGKKMYLNENGDLKRAFDNLGIEYGTTAELDSITFEEFIHPVINPKRGAETLALPLIDDSYSVNTWNHLLNQLGNNKFGIMLL